MPRDCGISVKLVANSLGFSHREMSKWRRKKGATTGLPLGEMKKIGKDQKLGYRKMKFCYSCLTLKAITQFRKKGRTRKGTQTYESICKECEAKRK